MAVMTAADQPPPVAANGRAPRPAAIDWARALADHEPWLWRLAVIASARHCRQQGRRKQALAGLSEGKGDESNY